jgi:hypothetical protein
MNFQKRFPENLLRKILIYKKYNGILSYIKNFIYRECKDKKFDIQNK